MRENVLPWKIMNGLPSRSLDSTVDTVFELFYNIASNR